MVDVFNPNLWGESPGDMFTGARAGASTERVLEMLQPQFATLAADFQKQVATLDTANEQSMLNFQLSQARFKAVVELVSTLIKLFSEGNRRIIDNMR